MFNLLLSSDFYLQDIICIVRLEKRHHNEDDLQYFGQIRKAKLFHALLCLKDNNTLYKDIVIIVDFINTWKGEFVFASILSRVLQFDEDIQEREHYVIELEVGHFENNLYQL